MDGTVNGENLPHPHSSSAGIAADNPSGGALGARRRESRLRPKLRTLTTGALLLASCAVLVLSGVASAMPIASHGDGHSPGGDHGFTEWCARAQTAWGHAIPGCPPPAPRPPSRPPTTSTSKPTTTTRPSTTTTTKPIVTPETVPPEPPQVVTPPAADTAEVAAPPVAAASSPSRAVTVAPDVPLIVPVAPALPATVPTLEQPAVPPAASFEDDVLLPASLAMVLAVAGMATAFLVFQGATGRRGPRGPAAPIDDGETLEFR